LVVGFQLKGQIIDIIAIKTYVSDKGCLIFLNFTIVKTVIFGTTLLKTHRKTRDLFVDVHPSHSEN